VPPLAVFGKVVLFPPLRASDRALRGPAPSRNAATATTLLFLATSLGAHKIPARRRTLITSAAIILITIAYITTALATLNAAHLGGGLVHVHGVKIPLSETRATCWTGESAAQCNDSVRAAR